MTTVSEWVQGARPRTLGAAVVPVVVATALASIDRPTIWWRAADALIVALARPADVPALVGDPAKLIVATGWQPTHTLDDTLTDILTAARALTP